jgi:hypothetical protein
MSVQPVLTSKERSETVTDTGKYYQVNVPDRE